MNELENIKRELQELQNWKKSLEASHSIPLSFQQAIKQRFFGTNFTVSEGGTGATSLTGILKGNGTSAITAITPLSGTKVYYVSDSSGGAVNRKLTFTNGILTAET